MGLRQRMRRRETITYWPPNDAPTHDDFGDPIPCVAPCELCARWQEERETTITAEGTTYAKIAFVYPETPVKRGGYLFRGPVSALTESVADPVANGAREIVMVEEFPAIRLGEQLDKVWIGEAT